jgi:hypothetical protein
MSSAFQKKNGNDFRVGSRPYSQTLGSAEEAFQPGLLRTFVNYDRKKAL